MMIWLQTTDANGTVTRHESVEHADRSFRCAAALSKSKSPDDRSEARAWDNEACAGEPVARWRRSGRRVERVK